MMNLGVLISGRGSNFEAIARAVAAGKIPANISLMVSNRPEAAGLDRAAKMGLNAQCIASSSRTRDQFEGDLLAALNAARVDHVCLAGFMRILSPQFVRAFRGYILNIHPSLLPSFSGLAAQKQALEYGVKLTGCTVHLLDEGVDTGPVILQAAVPVLEEDTVETLSARILEQEHRIYPEAVRLLAEDRIRVHGRHVFLSL
ncbi:MAG: phosphoribosylglycinamide formyltransferase [Terriglobia bacterium]